MKSFNSRFLLTAGLLALGLLLPNDIPAETGGASAPGTDREEEGSGFAEGPDSQIDPYPVFPVPGSELLIAETDGMNGVGFVDLPVTSGNLLMNSSFDDVEGDQPVAWGTRTFSGSADFEIAAGEGLKHGNAVRIRSDDGADAAWYTSVTLEEEVTYRLSGWIRTEDIEEGTGRGAQLNVHTTPVAETRTRALTGTNDWTYVDVTFVMDQTRMTNVNALFGGWGESTGTAWFDEIKLVEIGYGETDSDPVGTPEPVAREGGGPRTIHLGTREGVLRFDTDRFRVRSGESVRIVFANSDQVEHNLLILEPGALELIGVAADGMITHPEGRANQYVPASGFILHATPLVPPGETYTLEFTAPDETGHYPFVCTYPGHWRIMNGLMTVE